MLKVSQSVIRLTALTLLVGGFSHVGALNAQPVDTDTSVPSQHSPSMSNEQSGLSSKDKTWGDHDRRVENRIKTLHHQLRITQAQESEWNAVTQTMRDNESSINHLIEERHQNVQDMTAIDDLQSYATIAQAHADGVKKLIIVFQLLYNDMSGDQKKIADKVFGSSEKQHASAKMNK